MANFSMLKNELFKNRKKNVENLLTKGGKKMIMCALIMEHIYILIFTLLSLVNKENKTRFLYTWHV